jgi:hypothetical protein
MSLVKNTHPFPNERLFDVDPISGTKTYFSSGGKWGGEWAFRQEFTDVSPEVDASRELQKTDDHWKDGVKKEFVHYAHIPDAILLQWYQMGVDINDPKELTKMVNKPNWSYLKCVGKVHV